MTKHQVTIEYGPLIHIYSLIKDCHVCKEALFKLTTKPTLPFVVSPDHNVFGVLMGYHISIDTKVDKELKERLTYLADLHKPKQTKTDKEELERLSKQWVESDGKDLIIEGFIINLCNTMDIDCDKHFETIIREIKP